LFFKTLSASNRNKSSELAVFSTSTAAYATVPYVVFRPLARTFVVASVFGGGSGDDEHSPSSS
jgi:hypothetical protein